VSPASARAFSAKTEADTQVSSSPSPTPTDRRHQSLPAAWPRRPCRAQCMPFTRGDHRRPGLSDFGILPIHPLRERRVYVVHTCPPREFQRSPVNPQPPRPPLGDALRGPSRRRHRTPSPPPPEGYARQMRSKRGSGVSVVMARRPTRSWGRSGYQGQARARPAWRAPRAPRGVLGGDIA
jgi:hypothetical protein